MNYDDEFLLLSLLFLLPILQFLNPETSFNSQEPLTKLF